jgi:formyl-CoA transferase
MNSIGVAASKIHTVAEVVEDPLVAGKVLTSTDEKTGFELTMAPPPASTAFLAESGNKLSFPPRFGEHNESILGNELGISSEELNAMKADGII